MFVNFDSTFLLVDPFLFIVKIISKPGRLVTIVN